MNNKISRKVLSFMLAVVMLFSVSATAVAADEKYDNPIIVVNGIGNNPIYANPNTTGAKQLFPPSDLTMYAMTAPNTSGLAA